MKNLFNFIIKHIHWLLFCFLTAASVYLLVNNSEFQRSRYLTVFHEVAGRVYNITSSVQSYLNLRETNTDLMQRIVTLEEEIQTKKNELEYFTDRTHLELNNFDIEKSFYPFMPARVVRNQVSGINNYIRLNKGSNDGVAEDMGVVSIKGGIVGVVVKVSPNFSHVNPVLHSGFHPSCMIKKSRFSGSLFWDGSDPRYISLSGLPSHATYTIGDTVITSGYSPTFPEGILVGIIEGTLKQKNEESNSFKIRLFTDFSTLNEVFIIKNPYREEIIQIEKEEDEE